MKNPEANMTRWICLLLLCLAVQAAAQTPCRTRAREFAIVIFNAESFQPGDSILALEMALGRCVGVAVYTSGEHLWLSVWNLNVPVRFSLRRDDAEYDITNASGETWYRPRYREPFHIFRPILTIPKQ